MLRDKFALVSVSFLLLVFVSAVLGPLFLGDIGTSMNLRARNAPPFELERGFWYILGGDPLGRSILARIILAAQTTLLIAGSTVLVSATVGVTLGLIAGYRGGFMSDAILRVTDIIMSFPSLLLALVVLYVFDPSVLNVVIVLAVTRIPVFLRTTRAEVMEIRSRMFVISAEVTGASVFRVVTRHILPMVAPTIATLMTIDFAFVMLAEASLSFLGLGVQAPDVTWGVMVSEGRGYLATAWWLSFWPGLAITLVTMSLNIVSNWLRIATDPVQRWRLESEVNSNE
ncbi:dipeptide transport system permease protein DppC [Pelagibacterium halotolerans B2]|uniref:Dipeptide transport system permease protein DppC n=1 Tax=Pelagibacterium halotolerans (strain DSM 22347 / JCM 15775 / CGMCC 1.7692 / B2) TaxID=1082931 RepID=G4RD87_PELHB|nr:dipeptide transport system permease protein DppC [Pelagibacterium halotolerans B2]